MNPESETGHTDAMVEKIARTNCGRIFETKAPSEWKGDLIERLHKYDYVTEDDIARAEEILEGVEEIDDKDAFVERALLALRPIIDHVKADPEGYQAELRDHALSDPEKVPVNDLLYYHVDKKGNMHLHVHHNMLTDNREKLAMLRDGLKEVASILNSNPQINNVYATSWIVAENPKLMKMLGFEVHGKIGKLEEKKNFEGETREIWKASISREDFISKYL